MSRATYNAATMGALARTGMLLAKLGAMNPPKRATVALLTTDKSYHLRCLTLELDQVWSECRNPLLDELWANFTKLRRHRGRSLSDAEFKPKEKLLWVILFYDAMRRMIREARRRIAAGEGPTPVMMNQIRGSAVVIKKMALDSFGSEFATHLGGQRRQVSLAAKYEERNNKIVGKVADYWLTLGSYGRAHEKVASEQHPPKDASTIRKIAPKRLVAKMYRARFHQPPQK